MRLYAIWCFDEKDWLREPPSKCDNGRQAVLAFTVWRQARARAAKTYGYMEYKAAERDGWCEVRRVA